MQNTIYNTKQQSIKALLLTVFMAVSCASISPVSLEKTYRKEVDMEIDGVKAKGVYVAAKRPTYKIRFELPDSPSVVKITTCHREETFRNVGKRLDYDYRPVLGLEDLGSCMLEMGAFDEDGCYMWALIDFEDDEKMPAWIGCNGVNFTARGASLCQSKAGLVQTLTFGSAVEAFSKDNCPKMESKDKIHFSHSMAPDKCIYLFSNGKDLHRHTTFGYDEVLIK